MRRLTVQDMLDIAARHVTAMADAMVAACVAWSLETGVKLDFGAVPRNAGGTARMPSADETGPVDCGRMMRTNTDTRWQHV